MKMLDDALRSGVVAPTVAKKKPAMLTSSIDTTLALQGSSFLQERIGFVESTAVYESTSRITSSLKSKYFLLRSVLPARSPCKSYASSSEQTNYSASTIGPSFLPSTSSAAAMPFARKSVAPKDPTQHIPGPAYVIDEHPINMEFTPPSGLRSLGTGLANGGNTCFLNSVLQVLSHTGPLVNYILQHHTPDQCKAMSNCGFCAICIFQGHVRMVLDSSRHPFDCAQSVLPRSFISKLRSHIMKSYIPGRQEDAHEFLRFLIDAMHSSRLYPYKSQKIDVFTKETNIISRIFGGYMRNLIQCNNCKEKSATFDPFLDLSLELKLGFHGSMSTVEECLRSYTRAEELKGANAYRCIKCKRPVAALKRYSIHRAPQILTIHLKRFDNCGKINRTIQYKEKLDLRSYMSDQGTSSQANCIYRLFGVIVHQGNTTHSGHYYAFVRSLARDGGWHCMDDSMVRPIADSDVLSHQQAYMLFYYRLRSPPEAAVRPQTRTPVPSASVPNLSSRLGSITPVNSNLLRKEPAGPTPLTVKFNVIGTQKPTQPVAPTTSSTIGNKRAHPDSGGGKLREQQRAIGISAKHTEQQQQQNRLLSLVPYDDDEDESLSGSQSPKVRKLSNTSVATPLRSRGNSNSPSTTNNKSASLDQSADTTVDSAKTPRSRNIFEDMNVRDSVSTPEPRQPSPTNRKPEIKSLYGGLPLPNLDKCQSLSSPSSNTSGSPSLRLKINKKSLTTVLVDQDVADKRSPSPHPNNIQDGQGDEEIVAKKRHKKHKKKKKHKHRQSESNEPDEDQEMKQETEDAVTSEEQRCSSNASGDTNDTSSTTDSNKKRKKKRKKRRSSDDNEQEEEQHNQNTTKEELSESLSSRDLVNKVGSDDAKNEPITSSIVDQLQRQGGSRGYGPIVTTWGGTESSVNERTDRERRHYSDDEDYETEMERRRRKKRHRLDRHSSNGDTADRHYDEHSNKIGRFNRFQTLQNRRNNDFHRGRSGGLNSPFCPSYRSGNGGETRGQYFKKPFNRRSWGGRRNY